MQDLLIKDGEAQVTTTKRVVHINGPAVKPGGRDVVTMGPVEPKKTFKYSAEFAY